MISLEQFRQSSPSMVGFHSQSEIHVHTLSGNRIYLVAVTGKRILLHNGMQFQVLNAIVKNLSSYVYSFINTRYNQSVTYVQG
jgi:hypothetical protein